jgi:hypothetical protein
MTDNILELSKGPPQNDTVPPIEQLLREKQRVQYLIRDAQFMNDVRQLKALRSYMIQQAKMVTQAGPIELGQLNLLHFAEGGRFPTAEEWSDLERQTKMLYGDLSETDRRRFLYSQIPRSVIRTAGILAIVALVSLFVAFAAALINIEPNMKAAALQVIAGQAAGTAGQAAAPEQAAVPAGQAAASKQAAGTAGQAAAPEQAAVPAGQAAASKQAAGTAGQAAAPEQAAVPAGQAEVPKKAAEVTPEQLVDLIRSQLYAGTFFNLTMLTSFLAWVAALGGIGSIAFIGMNALAVQEDATFDITNTKLIGLRVLLGALFGVVLTLPFGYGSFSDFVTTFSKPSESTTGLAIKSILMLLPFILGFSTTLVIMIMNQFVEAIQTFFGKRSTPPPPPAPPDAGKGTQTGAISTSGPTPITSSVPTTVPAFSASAKAPRRTRRAGARSSSTSRSAALPESA